MLDKYIGKCIKVFTDKTLGSVHTGVLIDYCPVGILVRITQSDHAFYDSDDTVFFSYTNLEFKFV